MPLSRKCYEELKPKMEVRRSHRQGRILPRLKSLLPLAPRQPGASYLPTRGGGGPTYITGVCVCVCVCVCVRHFSNALVYPGRPRPALGTPMAWHYSWHLIFLIFALSFFFLHFPSDAISSYIHVRTSFSGPRRCVCSIVSWGLTTAGTPTARCTRGGRIDSLITLRHWCWNTHGSNPIVSLEGMSGSGFLPAK